MRFFLLYIWQFCGDGLRRTRKFGKCFSWTLFVSAWAGPIFLLGSVIVSYVFERSGRRGLSYIALAFASIPYLVLFLLFAFFET